MKTMFSGTGAAFSGFWRALPAPAKVVLVAGGLMLCGAELVVVYNEARNSADLTSGHAATAVGEGAIKTAQGAAQNADIDDIRYRMSHGRKVTLAEAALLTEFDLKKAETDRTRAEAGIKQIELEINQAVIGFIANVVKAAGEK